MLRRSSATAVVSKSPAIFEPVEPRQLLSVTPKWVEVPISSAAKTADSTLNNYRSFDLQVTIGSGDDWTGGDLKVNLSSGRFYVPASGNSNVEQKSLWSSKPNLQFDTFVSGPNFSNPILLGRSSYPTRNTGDEIFNSTTVDVAWGDLVHTAAGTYTIARLTIQNGSTGTTDGRVLGAINPSAFVTFNSGVPPTGGGSTGNTGSISGQVFKDSNGNGVKDSGEGILSGVKIYLDSNNNSTPDSGEKSTTTDSSGNYKFSSLAAGTYKIRQVLPSGYAQTTPTNNFGNNATLSSNSSSVSGKNFGDKPTTSSGASISGTVFHDFDRDGTRDSGDTALSGWTVYIDLDNDSILDSNEVRTTTDSSGNYKFSNLAAGTYKIRVVRQSGWTQTTPSNNFGHSVTVSSGQSKGSENFGFDN